MIADGDAVEGGDESDHDERIAPAGQRRAERQEADEADHAGLHRRPAERRGGGDWRGRVGQRHPAVERREAHLHAEAGDEQRQRAVAPGGGGQRRDNILDPQAAAGLAGGKQREGEQQQRLAENREGHVDAARPLRRGRVAIGDENVGRDADKRIDEIECEEIGGDEDAETAGHREQPRDREAPARPALGACKGGRAGDDPQDRREREQERARQIEPEAQAQCGRLEPDRASRDDEDCSRPAQEPARAIEATGPRAAVALRSRPPER